MSFWPFGRRTLTPGVWPARAGTWAAAGPNTGKYSTPGTLPIQSSTGRSVESTGINGQVSGTFPSSGDLTLSVGPAGIGTSWALDQAGYGTSVGQSDPSTCAVYVGPQAIQSFIVAQSYAGGGGSVGLAGITIQPGSFIFVVWTGGTPGATASVVVTGNQSVLAAAS
jgi:hypothetical protein